MTDITYDNTATQLRGSQGLVAGKGEANSLKCLFVATIEAGAVVADGDTIVLGRIPANVRISNLSVAYWDDLATAGSPTLDIGLASVGSNVTSDADALSNGHDLATVNTAGIKILGLFADSGKRAWELVSGQTVDPGGSLDVYASVVDAATNQAGTIHVEVYGYFD